MTLITAHGGSPFQTIWHNVLPHRVLGSLWGHRDLARHLIGREVEARYRGSLLGPLWAMVTPLALMGIYVYVFGLVFRQRWGSTDQGDLGSYGLQLFAGMIAFNLFAECSSRAPGLVLAVPNYVKKVVFPLHVLPLGVAGAALVHACIALFVLAIGELLIVHRLPITFPLAIIVLLPLLLASVGTAWFLASLGVYIRDVGQVVTVAIQVLLFATPIFYPREAVPMAMRPWLDLNPLTTAVECLRSVTVVGRVPDLYPFSCLVALSLVCFFAGHAWFMVTRKGFADVI